MRFLSKAGSETGKMERNFVRFPFSLLWPHGLQKWHCAQYVCEIHYFHYHGISAWPGRHGILLWGKPKRTRNPGNTCRWIPQTGSKNARSVLRSGNESARSETHVWIYERVYYFQNARTRLQKRVCWLQKLTSKTCDVFKCVWPGHVHTDHELSFALWKRICDSTYAYAVFGKHFHNWGNVCTVYKTRMVVETCFLLETNVRFFQIHTRFATVSKTSAGFLSAFQRDGKSVWRD